MNRRFKLASPRGHPYSCPQDWAAKQSCRTPLSNRPAKERSFLLVHGSAELPSVSIDGYSLEVEDKDGFAGDRANKQAFTRILDELREALRESGEDPLGSKPTEEISRAKLGELLSKGAAEKAAVVLSAIESFAQELKEVTSKFLRLKSWRDTECIVVGGGFRDSRVGELAIARTNILLKGQGMAVDMQLLEGDPDEAALRGTAHLLPSWMLEGRDAMLAVDIGGTNIRVGIVELNLGKANDLSKSKVLEMKLWCHREDEHIKRDEAVDKLVAMLETFHERARKDRLSLLPVIGVGCPGVIRADGTIAAGTQNLPGNWESSNFHLPDEIRKRIPKIDDHETTVILHNDAVVQGLSQIPRMHERRRWGIFTIGTGLGNARFTANGKSKE